AYYLENWYILRAEACFITRGKARRRPWRTQRLDHAVWCDSLPRRARFSLPTLHRSLWQHSFQSSANGDFSCRMGAGAWTGARRISERSLGEDETSGSNLPDGPGLIFKVCGKLSRRGIMSRAAQELR